VARRHQIGSQAMVKTTIPRMKDGRPYEEEAMVYQTKPRKVLEEELKKALTITIDVPKDYWTEAQQYAWDSNNLSEAKEISEERRVKMDAGILTELKPFEEGLDEVSSARLLCELTEQQWEFFKAQWNYYLKDIEGMKDETGRQKRKVVPRLLLKVHEYIPESDEDIKKLEEKESNKGFTEEAVKFSLAKYGKSKTK
jgi:hypothetical protein